MGAEVAHARRPDRKGCEGREALEGSKEDEAPDQGEVRAGRDLEEVFVEVVGGRIATGQELSWL